MSGALGGPGEFNAELLRRIKFCIGVKRGSGYRCGGEAGEDAKSKAVELLVETINRILRWRIWDSWWVVEWMDEWLEKRDRLEVQLRGKYGDEVVNAITGLVDEFINYNEKFWNYWHKVDGEVKKLIEDLINGRTEVVIRGEDVSGISVHGRYVTLEVDKMNNDSITVHLSLRGLKGVTINVPNIFKMTMSKKEYSRFIRKVLKALRGGLEETDGFVNGDKAAIGTSQVWQVIIWALLYPGRARVRINAININENNVTVLWYLRSSHKPLKGIILNDANKLSEKELLAFMFTVILGDGSVDIVKVTKDSRVYDEAVIKIGMSSKKFNTWAPLLGRLKEMGFRSGKPDLAGDGVVDVRFYGSNAIGLTRAMISVLPPILRDVLDTLDFEKWLSMKRVAEMEVRWRRGEMSIDIAGYKFTVHIQNNTVMLEHKVRDDIETRKVIDALRARYGDEFAINVHKSGKQLAIRIPMYIFEKYEDIKEQVIEVLCRKLKKTKDEKKRQVIIKHLKLLAPMKRAVVHISSCVITPYLF